MSTTPTNVPLLPAYPATLKVDYPDRNLNRLTSFFRIFTIIPILIIHWAAYRSDSPEEKPDPEHELAIHHCRSRVSVLWS